MAKRTLPTSLKQITYRDFDIQFRRHPSTGKLLIKKDDEAVKQALKTLILTNFYEKPFFPRFGGGIGMTRMARAYELMKQEQMELV